MNKNKYVLPTLTDNIEARALLQHLRNNFDLEKEKLDITAKYAKAKYDSLVKEGFTEAQAIELCKNSII